MAQDKEPSRKARLKALEKSLDPDGELSPKAVIALQMQWFNSEAESLLTRLIARLEEHGARSEVLLNLWRELIQMRRDAVDTASKLVKFVHPSLEAVSVKQETTHHFVIQAPPIIEDAEKWLEHCRKDAATRAVATDIKIDAAIDAAKQKPRKLTDN
jgi:hypothetical protein